MNQQRPSVRVEITHEQGGPRKRFPYVCRAYEGSNTYPFSIPESTSVHEWLWLAKRSARKFLKNYTPATATVVATVVEKRSRPVAEQRLPEPCEKCDGKGYYKRPDLGQHGMNVECEDCDGTGEKGSQR